jgi:hypothetical protein
MMPLPILVALDLDVLLVVTNVLSAMSQVLMMAAAVSHRISHPGRPICLPNSFAALLALITPPVAICSWLIFSVIISNDWDAPILAGFLISLGVAGAFFFFSNYRVSR